MLSISHIFNRVRDLSNHFRLAVQKDRETLDGDNRNLLSQRQHRKLIFMFDIVFELGVNEGC